LIHAALTLRRENMSREENRKNYRVPDIKMPERKKKVGRS
jgi:hypothetical protein